MADALTNMAAHERGDAFSAQPLVAPRSEATGWPSSVQRSVVCIGTQKAATSFVFDQVAKDPRVCVPEIKEVHYWDCLDGVEPRRFQKRAMRGVVKAISPKSLASSSGRRTLGLQGSLVLARSLGRRGLPAYRSIMLKNYTNEPVLFEASPGIPFAGQERSK